MAKLDAARRIEIVEGLVAKIPQRVLAAKHRVSQATISATGKVQYRGDLELLQRQVLLRAQSTRKTYQRTTKEQQVEIHRLYHQERWTRAALAAAFKISTSAVSNITGSRVRAIDIIRSAQARSSAHVGMSNERSPKKKREIDMPFTEVPAQGQRPTPTGPRVRVLVNVDARVICPKCQFSTPLAWAEGAPMVHCGKCGEELQLEWPERK
jgi:hypothetical protein